MRAMVAHSPIHAMPLRSSLTFELVLLALLALLWGSSYPLIKIAVAEIPPVTLIAMRVALAALFLLAVTRLERAGLPKDWETWRMLLVQALLNSIGSWTVLAWGQQHVDSGLAGVLNSTSPIFVFFIALSSARHEPVDGWKLSGALLGLGGVALVVGLDAFRGLGTNVLAQAAILLGAAMYAGAAIYGTRFSHLSPTVTAAGTMIWATVFLVPLSLLVDRPWMLAPSLGSLLAAGVLGVFCTGIALLIYFRLVRTLGSMGVASQSYLRAGVGIVLGIALLGEQLTLGIACGLVLTILGVAAINVVPAIRRQVR